MNNNIIRVWSLCYIKYIIIGKWGFLKRTSALGVMALMDAMSWLVAKPMRASRASKIWVLHIMGLLAKFRYMISWTITLPGTITLATFVWPRALLFGWM